MHQTAKHVQTLAAYLDQAVWVETAVIGFPVEPNDASPSIMLTMTDGTVIFLTVQEL